MRNPLRTLATIQSLWRSAQIGATGRDRRLAFLVAGLVSLGLHRKATRRWFLRQINGFAREGQVPLALRLNGRPLTFAMRAGDEQDFLIGGELVKGAYAPPTFAPRRIVDGGANIGMFALFAHSLFPDATLVCYEPDERNLAQLRYNLAANAIPAQVRPVGLWSRTTTLYYHAVTSYNGYVDEKPPGAPIPCAPPEIGPDCWLKLDIEGSEYEVIPALLERRDYPRWLTMEIHRFDERGAALVAQLREHGYQVAGDLSPTASCVTIEARREAS
ncbi:MAG: hypothetical protein CFK52_09055 [Chloracidobacterium sp. CP2_5A]|nr:MAG: hypothetical protein CFK52_09055 [Chloracidobacterium sp. CP2_5A]